MRGWLRYTPWALFFLVGCQGGANPFVGRSTSTPNFQRGGALHGGSGLHDGSYVGGGNPQPFFGENGMFGSLAGRQGNPDDRFAQSERPRLIPRPGDEERDRERLARSVDAQLAQARDLDERARRLDADNRDLTSQLAQAQQLLQVERDQKRLMQQQLADAGQRLQETLVAREEAERRASTSAQFASRRTPGASVRADGLDRADSAATPLRTTSIAGLETRVENGVMRVEIPGEKLFERGMVQLSPRARDTLDEVAYALGKSYPRNLIVVEGHVDADPNARDGGTLSHQVSSAQAQAVLDYLVREARVPPGQISSMAFGQHRPRMSNGTAQGRARNHRIEIAVYPETTDAPR